MKATATVLVTVQVTLNQPWADECPVNQVWEQAGRSAEERVRSAIAASPIMRVVAVKTTCVLTEPE